MSRSKESLLTVDHIPRGDKTETPGTRLKLEIQGFCELNAWVTEMRYTVLLIFYECGRSLTDTAGDIRCSNKCSCLHYRANTPIKLHHVFILMFKIINPLPESFARETPLFGFR